MANSNIDYGVEYQDKNGAWIQAIAIATAAPLDYRLKVKYFSDLTNAETWQVQGTGSGNKGFNTAYHGMLSYVANDSESGSSGLYVLTPGEAGSASADALVAANWVKISQTDATIEELRSLIDAKQSEAISVSGLTGATVQAVLEDISARLAGAATGGNLEALGNRVTAVEGNVSALSAADAIFASDIATVSGAVDTVAADVEAVSGVAVENAADIAEIQTALEDIYTKDETDSLITSAIADAATLEIVVWDGTIAELLQSVGEPKKIYLVANSGNPNNAKDEYIYTDGKWELIGTTATDLSNYFTKSETQSAIDTTVAGVSAGLQSGVEANAAAIKAINETTIPAVEAKVDTVSGKADANASEIAAVKATVETVSGKADANAAAIEAVAADVEYVSGQVDASVEGIEDAIEAVAADVETVSGKAEANAGLIAGLRTDVNAVSGSVAAFNGRVDDLEAQHDSINSRIEAAEKDIEALEQADTLKANSDATNINAGLWKTALGIDTLEGTVADNTDAIEAVDADVEYVSGAVDANTAEIAKKAAQTDFITLSGKVDANAAAIATKASQAEFVTLSGKVDANAAAVATKASQTDLTTVSALAEANAAAVATKADAAEVSSTYLKKSGDTSLVLGEFNEEEGTGVEGSLSVHGALPTEGTFIGGGYIRTYTDAGGAVDIGGGLSISSYGQTLLSVDAYNGFSGDIVDTTIPKESKEVEDGHIATTGAIKTYVDDQVSAVKTSITTAYIYRGSDTYENIAAKTDAKVGDVWNSTTANGNIPAGTNYAWNGTSWDALGGEVDLSAYATTESVTTALNTAISGVEADIKTVSEEVQAVAAGTSDKIAKASWKSKLGFIESTEVSAYQAQVDWNATEGVTSIANKPKIRHEESTNTTIVETSAFTIGEDDEQTTYVLRFYDGVEKQVLTYDPIYSMLELTAYITSSDGGNQTCEKYTISSTHIVKEIVSGGSQTSLQIVQNSAGEVELNWNAGSEAFGTVVVTDVKTWWF